MNLLTAVLHATEGEAPVYEAHHWWWPENLEIIWGGLASLIVFFLLYKFGKAPIVAFFKNRTARVAEQLDKSATAKAEADAEAAQVRADLADLDARKAQIVADARVQADKLREEGAARNDAEMADLVARARADIEAARGRSVSELQHQVGSWAAEAAERYVSQSLDEGLRQQLVEDFIAKVGAA